ncbi:hypothetical protein HMSSN036_76610 [Paenibacillus macerans]|nr:hypothetical protein HMSSN036_76610 [Paenibacillus macerans]
MPAGCEGKLYAGSVLGVAGHFYAILVLLFFCLYLYQNALLGQAASAAADAALTLGTTAIVTI